MRTNIYAFRPRARIPITFAGLLAAPIVITLASEQDGLRRRELKMIVRPTEPPIYRAVFDGRIVSESEYLREPMTIYNEQPIWYGEEARCLSPES